MSVNLVSRLTTSGRRAAAIGATAVAVAGGLLIVPATTATAATTCTAVDIAFARGTFESAGLGMVGTPFVSSLTSDLSGKTVSSYAVNYAASADQTSAGPGSGDLVSHIKSVAASCPKTKFVLGGYSQGASVVDYVVGVTTGSTGTALPSSLASKVAAIVVFGNPLGLQGKTIEKASSTYGARTKSFCNSGDPVCGSGFNVIAHLQYASNGSTTTGATFAAGKI